MTTHWTGDRIRRLRRRHGWTQEDMAEWMGLTKSTISRLETGDIVPRGPTLKLLILLHQRGDSTPVPIVE